MNYESKRTLHVLRWRLSIGLAAVCACLPGCSKSPHSEIPTAPVTITVTYGGEAVTEGQVDLNNAKTGLGGGGALDGQGNVVLPAVPLGEYTVTVLPPDASPLPTASGQPDAKPKVDPRIPKKVRDPEKSPFKAQVKAGKNHFTFDLKQAEK